MVKFVKEISVLQANRCRKVLLKAVDGGETLKDLNVGTSRWVARSNLAVLCEMGLLRVCGSEYTGKRGRPARKYRLTRKGMKVVAGLLGR